MEEHTSLSYILKMEVVGSCRCW